MDEKTLRREAEEVIKDKLIVDKFTFAAAKFVIENTRPLTIKESGWIDEEHHLTGATNRVGNDVVMLRSRDFGSPHGYLIVCVDGDYDPDALTPNGKKYEVKEIVPGLSSEQLEALPIGSIVGVPGLEGYTKTISREWTGRFEQLSSKALAECGNVSLLRRGWGDEKED